MCVCVCVTSNIRTISAVLDFHTNGEGNRRAPSPLPLFEKSTCAYIRIFRVDRMVLKSCFMSKL